MPIQELDITVIVDNNAEPGLVAEHGLSLWIDAGSDSILFDTGQGPALPANAQSLGISISRAKAMVLSHGHYDHTGAIDHVLGCNPDVSVYCHPATVNPRYRVDKRNAKPIHMPRNVIPLLDKLPASGIRWVTVAQRHTMDIGLTGPVPRRNKHEDTGGPFYLDPQGTRSDAVEDDMALWINTREGLVVCVGCCHAGLINTLTYVRQLSGVSDIRAVIGGFHLKQAGDKRIQWTLSELAKMSPALIVPCHCTGEKMVRLLSEQFPGAVIPGYAGLRLSFHDTGNEVHQNKQAALD